MSSIGVCVIGMGFVGTAIAAAWLRAGCRVIGVDISTERLDSIKRGLKLSEKKIVEAFENGTKLGTLTLDTEVTAASKATSVKFVCVPVYSDTNRRANLRFLESACSSLAANLKESDVVVICSSVPPGTTRNVVLPILESRSKLQGGKDFHLVYSPERILVGRAIEDIEDRYPAIISGLDECCVKEAESIFSVISRNGTIRMPSLEAAEIEKLVEGVYRDVNIALANELAMICDELGIDFWSVQNAANSQPFCHIHTPGFGVGGACIPVYPWFVANSVHETHTRLIRESRLVNDSMTRWLVDSLTSKFHPNRETKIVILGVAFRADVNDNRGSIAYKLLRDLQTNNLTVSAVHDPIIQNDLAIGTLLKSDLEEALLEADIAILVTDHSIYKQFDWIELAQERKRPLILIDGKGMFHGKRIEGLEIFGLGNGDHGLTLFEAEDSNVIIH